MDNLNKMNYMLFLWEKKATGCVLIIWNFNKMNKILFLVWNKDIGNKLNELNQMLFYEKEKRLSHVVIWLLEFWTKFCCGKKEKRRQQAVRWVLKK